MQVSNFIGRFVTGQIDTVYNFLIPPRCMLCDSAVSKHGACCAECWSQIRFISPPMCPVLGTPFTSDFGDGFLSTKAISDPPPFERLRAAVLYDPPARRLVSGFKFHDRIDLAPYLARWMFRAARELFHTGIIIVPVPLHPSRFVARKFNQSAELARHLSGFSGLTEYYIPDLLLRHRPTQQQIGLTASQRERNVSGAFRVNSRKAHLLDKATILLIDDVYTTGATVKAATRCLMRYGASQVNVLVFAKVETSPGL